MSNIEKTFPKNIKAVVFDFDGVFTNNKVYLSEDGKESVRCDRSDGWGIGILQKYDLLLSVMSSEVNPVVLRRCEKLNLECYHQLKDSKYKCFLQWCEKKNISPSEVIYIGNDENDVECLKNAGCGIVPADAHDSAKKVSDFVLSKKGGDGAVRELADSISIYFNKT